MKALRWSGFIAVQILVTLALLEVACRFFNPLGISYFPETARYLDTLIHEEPIGYRNRPGLQGTYYGAPVSINSLGMRDREVAAKIPGEFRILVIGDSFPFGIGVPYEDSIPHQLEKQLNASAPPGRNYRTLNMGVPSYNTEQELIQLKDRGLGLEPDLAILLFSENDIERKKWVFDKRSKWTADLAQRSYAISTLFVLVRYARAAAKQPEQMVASGEYRLDSPRWQAIDRSLTEIKQLCIHKGIPFVLLTDFGLVGEPFKLLKDVAQREGFPIINLSPSQDPRWMDKYAQRFTNSVNDSHPNVDGSRNFAIMYAEYLNRSGILGLKGVPKLP